MMPGRRQLGLYQGLSKPGRVDPCVVLRIKKEM